jgi:hypothetical protein
MRESVAVRTDASRDPAKSPTPTATGPAGFRLRRRAHKVALTAHILASVGWFGVAVIVAFCGIAATVTGDPTLTPALYRTMETAPWLSVPLGILAVATGVLLGLGTKVGLIRYWWVLAKIVIAAAVIVTDALVVARVAHDAVVTGDPAAPLYGSTIAHVVMLAIATILSVFKPWGRTPRGRRLSGGVER